MKHDDEQQLLVITTFTWEMAPRSTYLKVKVQQRFQAAVLGFISPENITKYTHSDAF